MTKEKWFWFIVFMVVLIVTVPFIVIYFIFLLPPIWGPALAGSSAMTVKA
jgi:hypothetical protein